MGEIIVNVFTSSFFSLNLDAFNIPKAFDNSSTFKFISNFSKFREQEVCKRKYKHEKLWKFINETSYIFINCRKKRNIFVEIHSQGWGSQRDAAKSERNSRIVCKCCQIFSYETYDPPKIHQEWRKRENGKNTNTKSQRRLNCVIIGHWCQSAHYGGTLPIEKTNAKRPSRNKVMSSPGTIERQKWKNKSFSFTFVVSHQSSLKLFIDVFLFLCLNWVQWLNFSSFPFSNLLLRYDCVTMSQLLGRYTPLKHSVY